MVMQTSPGWIASMTDFWVTGGGLVVIETTMVGFKGYDVTKVPEYVRARNACQYADEHRRVGEADGRREQRRLRQHVAHRRHQDRRDRRLRAGADLPEPRRRRPTAGSSATMPRTTLASAMSRAATPATTTSVSRPARAASAGRNCSPSTKAASTPRSGRRCSATPSTPTSATSTPRRAPSHRTMTRIPMQYVSDPERYLERPLLPGRLGRRQSHHRRRGRGDEHVGPSSAAPMAPRSTPRSSCASTRSGPGRRATCRAGHRNHGRCSTEGRRVREGLDSRTVQSTTLVARCAKPWLLSSGLKEWSAEGTRKRRVSRAVAGPMLDRSTGHSTARATTRR